jgi:hypothetical protein
MAQGSTPSSFAQGWKEQKENRPCEKNFSRQKTIFRTKLHRREKLVT